MRFWTTVLVALISLAVSAHAEVLRSFKPVADGHTVYSWVVPRLEPVPPSYSFHANSDTLSAGNSMTTTWGGGWTRSVLEFAPIVSKGGSLVSATLKLDVTEYWGSNVKAGIKVGAIPGNGLAELNDGMTAGSLLGQADVSKVGSLSVELSASALQAQLSQYSSLCLIISGKTDPAEVRFISIEGQRAGLGSAPVLELTYTPEPATLAILGAGTLALIRRSRRN